MDEVDMCEVFDKSEEEIINDCERQQQSMLLNWDSMESNIMSNQYNEITSEKRPGENSEEGFITITRRKPKRLIRGESNLLTLSSNISKLGRKRTGMTSRARAKRLTRLPTPAPSPPRSDNEMDATYEVCLMSTKMLPKLMALAKLLREEEIKKILRIKYKSPYKVFVQLDDKIQAEKLISCQKILDLDVRAQFTNQANLSYGMIKGVDLEMNEQEIMDALDSEEVVSLKRLRRMNENGEWVDSETMRICFKGSTCPMYVYVFGCRFKIEKYVFPVTQCSGCWQFGHIKRLCPKNKTLCPKCGASHANCDAVRFTCLNCKGPHMALDKTCPFFVKEKKIRIIMSDENVTYKKALDILLNKNKQEVDLNDSCYVELPIRSVNKKVHQEMINTTEVTIPTIENYNNNMETDEIILTPRRELNEQQTMSKSQKKKKSNKKSRKGDDQNSILQNWDHIESDMREEQTYENTTQNIVAEHKDRAEEKKTEHKIDWKNILKKIRDAAFSDRLIEEKIMSIIKIVYTEIKTFVMNTIMKGDLLKGLLNLYNG